MEDKKSKQKPVLLKNGNKQGNPNKVSRGESCRKS